MTHIKHSVFNDEIKYCIDMRNLYFEIDIPMDEAMRWLETFNFNFNDFMKAIYFYDEDVEFVLTAMSGLDTGSKYMSFNFSIMSYKFANMNCNEIYSYWDKFVKKIVDSIRCAVVSHELKSGIE